MRIACPTCGAAYEVPADRLAPCRAVRCARCGARWTPAAVAPPPMDAPPASVQPVPPQPAPAASPAPLQPVPPPEPAPPPAPRPPVFAPAPRVAVVEPPIGPAAEPAHRPAHAGLVIAWLLTMFVLAGAVWAALVFRTEIVKAWPAAARAYTLLDR